MKSKKSLKKTTWWQQIIWLSTRFGLLVLSALLLFGIYLDAKITQRFDGEKWQLPSLVYSRALELFPGQRLTQTQLLHELTLLKYEQTTHPPSRPGEYQINQQDIYLLRRAFEFADGRQGVQPLHLQFKQQHLSAIREPASGREISYARLDPVLLDRLHLEQREDRILVKLHQVPQLLIDALITVEDQGFYTHWGISLSAIARALITNLRAGRTVQGGSTITQQLAKNFFLTRSRSIQRKIQEVYMAFLIDLRYSKADILEAYLNEVYLGQNFAKGVYGIGLASYFYFGRPIGELETHQFALLVALIKGPSYYDPWRYPQRAQARRDLVLRLIFEAGNLSVSQYKASLKKPLEIIARGSTALGKIPAFMGWLRQELIEKIGEDAASESGLKIFTSLDPIAQHAAEKAVRNTMQKLDPKGYRQNNNPLETALVISHWRKNKLIAIIGGRRPEFAGFNRAVDASRQIGSLVKPAVYLTALQQGYQLATPLKDEEITLTNAAGQQWSPRNFDRQFRGDVPFVNALIHSLNVPTVNLGMSVGLPEIIKTLRKLGVTTPLNPFPSLLLGAFNLTPIQANQMYLTLANQGVYQPLSAIDAVFKSGSSKPIYFERKQPQRRLDPISSWLTLWALTQVTEYGTSKRLKQLFPNLTLAAKTGTTDAFRDAWFTGIDNEEVVTIWLGKDDSSAGKFTGSSGPMRIYSAYLQARGQDNLQLFTPENIRWMHFSRHTGMPVKANCPDSLYLPATVDQPLAQDCDAKPKKNWLQRLFG